MRRLLVLTARAALLFALCALVATPASAQRTRLVNVFTGTGGTGHTYPGASAPFGLVQLSPDTRIDNSWESAAGYYYADSTIYGFSHTHLSGTGITDYGDVMFMPLVGDTATAPARVRQRFSHAREQGSPGYYGVTLDSGVRVRLTATPRVGLQEYRFARAGVVYVLLDLKHRDERLEARAVLSEDRRTLSGLRRSRAWAQDQRIYFRTELSRPYESAIVRADSLGTAHVLLRYTVRAGETLLIKTALSSTGEDGAARNLAAELPGWDFEATRRAADRRWNAELGRIAVSGGSVKDRQNFYTALYHTLVVPNVWSDVPNGQGTRRYLGRDGRVHEADHDVYTVYSLWDTFRTAHPLYTLLDRARTADFVRSFLLQYEQAGRLPVWELSANETNTMIGFHSAPVILEAYSKGVRGFDAALALRAMVDAARTDVAGERAFYDTGLLNAEDAAESVSKTLEFAYDHWTVAEMARRLGQDSLAAAFYRRSLGYRNAFDPLTRLMRPRQNGAWLAPFDPREVSNHYTEANAWQYSFFAPHDVAGLRALLGGPAGMEAHLDSLFAAPSQLRGRHQPDVTGLVGQYAHGNEPSHHVAYLYAYAGAPHKTQRLTRTILDSLYAPTPDGLPGNEDCGQMSAWFVMSALGLYPVTPGHPVYTLTTPLFDRAEVRLENGRRIVIEARGTGRYVRSLAVDGQPHPYVTLRHDAVANGATLRFGRSATPTRWGEVRAADEPAVRDEGFLAAPVVLGGQRSFEGAQTVALSGSEGSALWYTLDGAAPLVGRAVRYAGPFQIDTTATLRAISADERGNRSAEARARFVERPNDWDVALASTLHRPYDAGGPRGLTDGIEGTTMWRAGDWHGYQGQDFEAVIDLKAVRPVRRLAAGFLQDTRSWILLPRAVAFETSVDRVEWTPPLRVGHAVPPGDFATQRHTLGGALAAPVQARYVRVRATNVGALPPWHLGAGHSAYIFVDEIHVE